MILVVGPPNNNDGVPVFVSTLKGIDYLISRGMKSMFSDD